MRGCGCSFVAALTLGPSVGTGGQKPGQEETGLEHEASVLLQLEELRLRGIPWSHMCASPKLSLGFAHRGKDLHGDP